LSSHPRGGGSDPRSLFTDGVSASNVIYVAPEGASLKIQPADITSVEREERVDALLDSLEAGGVGYVEIAFQDLEGNLRSRLIKASKARRYLARGVPVDGYSVGYAPIEDSDMVAVPDLGRPWIYEAAGYKAAFFLADLYRDGRPLPWYPRVYLRELLGKAGVEYRMGVELEFYALVEGKPMDQGFYMSAYPLDALEPLKAEFMDLMERSGVDVALAHHEVGPGQHEFLTPPYDPLTLADFVVFYKKALKSFLYGHGVTATFMPKPFQGLPGNGMHLHISAYRGGENTFLGDPLSEEALWFLGGLIGNARRIAVYTNPTVNSYKRLVLGAEAPVYLVWGRGNRTAYVRVPTAHGPSGRLELRVPDSSGNIYLLVAAVLEAGRLGVEAHADPGPEYRGNAYRDSGLPRLPSSLMEAIEEAERAPLFPAELTGRYLALKKAEWKEYLDYLDENSITDDPNVVTDWERARYMHR